MHGEVQQLAGLRRRRVFEITAKGVGGSEGVAGQADCRRGHGAHVAELMLRFAFMDETLGAEVAGVSGGACGEVGFVYSDASGVSGCSCEGDEHVGAVGAGERDSGVWGRARLAWAKSSITRYRRRRKSDDDEERTLLSAGRVVSYDLGCWRGAFWLVVVSGVVLSAAFLPVARFGPRRLVDAVWGDPAVFACGGVVVHDVRALGFLSGSEGDGEAGYCGWVCDVYAGHGGAGVAGEAAEAYRGDGYAGGTPKGGGCSGDGFGERLCLCCVLPHLRIDYIQPVYAAVLSGGADLARSMGLEFWLIELARGVLMTLAVVPAIYTLRMRRWPAAIAVGVLVWVVGGLAPLIVPNELLGPTQRFIHTIGL